MNDSIALARTLRRRRRPPRGALEWIVLLYGLGNLIMVDVDVVMAAAGATWAMLPFPVNVAAAWFFWADAPGCRGVGSILHGWVVGELE